MAEPTWQWLAVASVLLVISSEGSRVIETSKIRGPVQEPTEFTQREKRTSCQPCEDRECDKIKKKKCPWGFVKDECHCCDVCAKGAGGSCGGVPDAGKCGNGMKCVVGRDPNVAGVCTPNKIGRKKFCSCGLPWRKTKQRNNTKK